MPSFPTPYKQDYESWGKILKSYVDIGIITEKTNFITHSLGSIFLVKFLLDNQIRVGKIITIAGFNNLTFEDDKKLYESFYMNEGCLQELKEYCPKRISFYSDNDPYVPLGKAIEFAEKIVSQKVFVEGAGHFNEKFGYKEFWQLLDYIDK